MTRVVRMRTVRVRETSVQQLPVALQEGASEWRRWRAWIIAGPILAGIAFGLLVFAIGVMAP